ncbi:hypothetical protein [Streptomyces spinosus]|uniref:hypothetical protein n=1 Tax=Streptomyces spinosus TaxID=2872623 RepID=UPI001CECBCF6|nr:hypothetical protein [Streptomyces spinosus]
MSRTADDYEQKHSAWRQAARDLAAARRKDRHSVDPAVNRARAAEQAGVRAEIKQAEEKEKAARKALNFPWER